MAEHTVRYRRLSDGVAIRVMTGGDYNFLAVREDTGRAFWVSAAGLRRKYELIEED